jgi:hypothetical protein
MRLGFAHGVLHRSSDTEESRASFDGICIDLLNRQRRSNTCHQTLIRKSEQQPGWQSNK